MQIDILLHLVFWNELYLVNLFGRFFIHLPQQILSLPLRKSCHPDPFLKKDGFFLCNNLYRKFLMVLLWRAVGKLAIPLGS